MVFIMDIVKTKEDKFKELIRSWLKTPTDIIRLYNPLLVGKTVFPHFKRPMRKAILEVMKSHPTTVDMVPAAMAGLSMGEYTALYAVEAYRKRRYPDEYFELILVIDEQNGQKYEELDLNESVPLSWLSSS